MATFTAEEVGPPEEATTSTTAPQVKVYSPDEVGPPADPTSRSFLARIVDRLQNITPGEIDIAASAGGPISPMAGSEEARQTPLVRIPDSAKAQIGQAALSAVNPVLGAVASEDVKRGVGSSIGGMLDGITSPAGVEALPAMAVPEVGAIAGPMLGIPAVVQGASELVHGQTAEERARGATTALLGAGAMAAPTLLPRTIEALESPPRLPRALPAPGESAATFALLPESPLGPRTAGYRIKVPPFEERPPIDVQATVLPPDAVENLGKVVTLGEELTRPAQPYQPPAVSTDLRQLEKIMQKNTVSTVEAWADKVIKDKLEGAGANPFLDPEFLSAALVKGTVLIKRGVTTFAEWSAPMVAQFGRDIIPHLETLYNQAADAAKKISTEPVRLATGAVAGQPATTPLQTSFGLAASPLSTFSDNVRQVWRGAANEALPKITASNNEVGEAGVRAFTSRSVGRDMGDIFADNVLKGLEVDSRVLGVFAAEDNLRWRKQNLKEQAARAEKEGNVEDATLLNEASDAVGTFVGAKGSPFQTEDAYQAYWQQPAVQEAAARHRALWAEQKDPLFRQANDLDPETPLASRGLISGMRVNMKAMAEGEKSPTALSVKDAAGPSRTGEAQAETSTRQARSNLIRQMATLKRSDPFNRTFTGLSQAYETDYGELMRNGFGRELPVAAQHEFIRKLIANGDAQVSTKAFEPELEIKGEPVTGRILTLKPWTIGPAKFLQVRRSLVEEYDSVAGLPGKDYAIHPAVRKAGDLLTRSSIYGLSEGTTHMGNLLSQVVTGPGPTSNPLLNGLLKAASGRADLLYSIPRVFIRAATASREDLLDLGLIGAAKQPYGGGLGKLVLNPTDRGVRLSAADLYDNFAASGWIDKPTETGKREFINQVGNYARELQPLWMRVLRDNFQPFVTAVHSFNVMGLRRMAGSAGIRDLTPAQRAAFAADIYGGWIGFITLGTGLNYLLNHNDSRVENKLRGPTGTKLGEVGWMDEEGTTHALPLARMAGYERGPRITGALPAAEALSRGLGVGEALDAGGQAVAQTGINYLTGPLTRFGIVASTGYRPALPVTREAPAVMPQEEDSFNPLKTQLAANIGTALKEANPLVDSSIELARGIMQDKSAGEIAEKAGRTQLSRYYPRTVSPTSASEDFATIVRHATLNRALDNLIERANREPESSRIEFIQRELDKVPEDLRKTAYEKLKRRGAFKSKQ